MTVSAPAKISKIFPAAHVQAMVRALRAAGAPIVKSTAGYVGKVSDREFFRAMKGGNGCYLVRYDANLFE